MDPKLLDQPLETLTQYIPPNNASQTWPYNRRIQKNPATTPPRQEARCGPRHRTFPPLLQQHDEAKPDPLDLHRHLAAVIIQKGGGNYRGSIHVRLRSRILFTSLIHLDLRLGSGVSLDSIVCPVRASTSRRTDSDPVPALRASSCH